MKTYSPKLSEITRQWHVIDAAGVPVGRLATRVALLLRGKHKPTYAPHLDMGDHVVVINAAQVTMTGGKGDQKQYYRHSGYPGGFRAILAKDELAKRPDRVIERAVRGMLPHTSLGRQMYRKLRVYAGATHPHAGQVVAGLQPARQPRPARREEPAQPPPAARRAPSTRRRQAASVTPAATAVPSATTTDAEPATPAAPTTDAPPSTSGRTTAPDRSTTEEATS